MGPPEVHRPDPVATGRPGVVGPSGLVERWRTYSALVRTSAANRFAYIGETLGRSGFYLILLYIMSHLWETIYLGGGRRPVAGFTPADMVAYLVVTEALYLSWPAFDAAMSRQVVTGEVAYALLRPIHFLGFVFGQFLGEFLVTFALNITLGVLVLAWLGTGPMPAGPTLPALIVLIALGSVLHFVMVATIGLTAFWIEEVRPIRWIYDKMMFTVGGLLIPLDMFPEGLRALAGLMPFWTILYAPARLSVHWDAGLFGRAILLQIFWIVVLGLVMRGVFERGVKQLHVHGG